jgi:ubiquinone/menaquinone biosynthesis C-methylase UbiE
MAPIYEDTSAMLKEFASRMLHRDPPLTADAIVLDNACGFGIVAGEIPKLPVASLPSEVYAADFSSEMIEILREKAERGGADGERCGRVHAQVMDATTLSGYEDDFFTHSFTNFSVYVFPDADKGATKIYRTLRRGGRTAVVRTSQKLGFEYLFQEAQQALSPDLPAFTGAVAPLSD